MPKSPLSLIGWHGRENAGDDAFCVVLSKWAVESLGLNHIQVTGETTHLPKMQLGSEVQVEGVLKNLKAGRIQRILREPRFLFGKSVVLFGAGSIFSVRRFAWLTLQLTLLRLLRRLRIVDTAIAAIGVSIGPFRKPAHATWCAKALRRFDIVVVRDKKSYELGQEFGIKNLIASYDLALALPSLFQIPTHTQIASGPQPVVGFSIVNRDAELGRPEIDAAKNEALFKALKSVAAEKPGTRFRGFVFCNDPNRGDIETTEAMLRRLCEAGLEVETVSYKNDPLELIGEIAKLDAMVCNRMHSFVFACLTRTPAVMLSYAPKMVEFARTVEVPESLQFSHLELDANRLKEALLKLIAEPAASCNTELLEKCSAEVVEHLEIAAEAIRKVNPQLTT